MKLTGEETEFIFIRLTVLHEYLEKELEMHNLPFKHDIEVGRGFYHIISTILSVIYLFPKSASLEQLKKIGNYLMFFNFFINFKLTCLFCSLQTNFL